MKRGITLIEVLVVSLIGSFILAGTSLFIGIVTRQTNKGYLEAGLQYTTERVLQMISSDIMNGATLQTKVNVDSTESSLIVFDKDKNPHVKYHFTIEGERSKLMKITTTDSSLISGIGVEADIRCLFEAYNDKSTKILLQLEITQKNMMDTLKTGYMVYNLTCRNPQNDTE